MKDGSDYQMRIWQRGGHFYGEINELGILESGGDASTVWKKVQQRKTEILTRFTEAGIENELPSPTRRSLGFSNSTVWLDRGGHAGPALRPLGWLGELETFAIKLVLAVGGVLFCLWMVKHYVDETLHKFTGKKIVLREVIQDFATGLESMPEEKREALHRALQGITTAVRPFAKDLAPLLSDISAPDCQDQLATKRPAIDLPSASKHVR